MYCNLYSINIRGTESLQRAKWASSVRPIFGPMNLSTVFETRESRALIMVRSQLATSSVEIPFLLRSHESCCHKSRMLLEICSPFPSSTTAVSSSSLFFFSSGYLRAVPLYYRCICDGLGGDSSELKFSIQTKTFSPIAPLACMPLFFFFLLLFWFYFGNCTCAKSIEAPTKFF